jgi:hypothetical protein
MKTETYKGLTKDDFIYMIGEVGEQVLGDRIYWMMDITSGNLYYRKDNQGPFINDTDYSGTIKLDEVLQCYRKNRIESILN